MSVRQTARLRDLTGHRNNHRWKRQRQLLGNANLLTTNEHLLYRYIYLSYCDCSRTLIIILLQESSIGSLTGNWHRHWHHYTKMRVLLLPTVTAIGFLVSQVSAFSNGAGGCQNGAAAVGGGHLAGSPTTGSLEDAGFKLGLNGRLIDNTLTTIQLKNNGQYDVAVVAPDGVTFKGLLVRAAIDSEMPNISLKPTDQLMLKETSICGDDVEAVTHVDSSSKSEAVGRLVLQSEGTLTFDITVVISNNGADGSEYYYSSYTFLSKDEFEVVPTVTPRFVDDTPAPTSNSTSAPAATPTVAPVPVPTAASAPSGDTPTMGNDNGPSTPSEPTSGSGLWVMAVSALVLSASVMLLY